VQRSKRSLGPTEYETIEAIGGDALGAQQPSHGKESAVGRAAGPAEARLRTGRLAGLSLNRAIWVLAWPILAESMLNSFVGLADTALAWTLDGAGRWTRVGDASGLSTHDILRALEEDRRANESEIVTEVPRRRWWQRWAS